MICDESKHKKLYLTNTNIEFYKLNDIQQFKIYFNNLQLLFSLKNIRKYRLKIKHLQLIFFTADTFTYFTSQIVAVLILY